MGVYEVETPLGWREGEERLWNEGKGRKERRDLASDRERRRAHQNDPSLFRLQPSPEEGEETLLEHTPEKGETGYTC